MHIETFVARDGTPLSCRAFGPQGGRTVLLCHGLTANGEQFGADAAYFAALGYRVLVPDIRGHGASGAPRDYRPDGFSLAVLADDMVRLLDHMEAGPVHWVGNSLGGIVAFRLVEDAPQRFASLATFGTAHRLALPSVAASAIPLLYGLLGTRLTAWSTALASTAHRPARPLVARMIAAHDPKVGRAIAHHVRAYDLAEAALGFAGPVLLLRGGRDSAVNRALTPTLPRFAGRPNFTRVELPRGGHMANLDATDAWREALLAFWDRVEAQA